MGFAAWDFPSHSWPIFVPFGEKLLNPWHLRFEFVVKKRRHRWLQPAVASCAVDHDQCQLWRAQSSLSARQEIVGPRHPWWQNAGFLADMAAGGFVSLVLLLRHPRCLSLISVQGYAYDCKRSFLDLDAFPCQFRWTVCWPSWNKTAVANQRLWGRFA